MDFIGTKSNPALHTPLPLDLKLLLQTFKEANNFLLLPKPTLVDDEILLNTIKLINMTRRNNEIILQNNGTSLSSSLTGTTATSQPSPHPTNTHDIVQ